MIIMDDDIFFIPEAIREYAVKIKIMEIIKGEAIDYGDYNDADGKYNSDNSRKECSYDS